MDFLFCYSWYGFCIKFSNFFFYFVSLNSKSPSSVSKTTDLIVLIHFVRNIPRFGSYQENDSVFKSLELIAVPVIIIYDDHG